MPEMRGPGRGKFGMRGRRPGFPHGKRPDFRRNDMREPAVAENVSGKDAEKAAPKAADVKAKPAAK